MLDFIGKGTPVPKFQLASCTNLKDDMSRGQDGFVSESPISTLLHDMIGDDPAGKCSSYLDFLHFATVSKDTRFTY